MLYHDYVWEEVQKYSMIPCMLLMFARLFYGVWNLGDYYFPELLPSHWELLTNFYDLRYSVPNQKEEEQRKERFKHLKKLERTWVDTCFYLYISTGIPYYYYDLFYKLIVTGIFNLDGCQWAYILHHITTIFFYKVYGNTYYFTWYFMFPSAYHSVMITYPNFYWNYHIYGVALGLFTFSHLLFETTRSTRVHKYLVLSVPLLTPSLVLIAIQGCQS